MYLLYVSYHKVKGIVLLYCIVLQSSENFQIFQIQIRVKRIGPQQHFQYGFGHSCRLKISKKFHNNS